jgi:hypothetical protein
MYYGFSKLFRSALACLLNPRAAFEQLPRKPDFNTGEAFLLVLLFEEIYLFMDYMIFTGGAFLNRIDIFVLLDFINGASVAFYWLLGGSLLFLFLNRILNIKLGYRKASLAAFYFSSILIIGWLPDLTVLFGLPTHPSVLGGFRFTHVFIALSMGIMVYYFLNSFDRSTKNIVIGLFVAASAVAAFIYAQTIVFTIDSLWYNSIIGWQTYDYFPRVPHTISTILLGGVSLSSYLLLRDSQPR